MTRVKNLSKFILTQGELEFPLFLPLYIHHLAECVTLSSIITISITCLLRAREILARLVMDR